MPRKSSRKPARKSARKSARKPARKSSRRMVKRASSILSSSYGISSEKSKKSKKSKKKTKKHPPIPPNIKGKKKKSKVSMQSEMDSFLAGIDSKPSEPKKASNWVQHVKNYWEERKQQDPDYKYKDAMKDAKKTWKK